MSPWNAQSMGLDLQQHQAVCEQLLDLLEQDHATLQGGGNLDSQAGVPRKKDLLARLNESLDRIRRHRAAWERLSREERQQHPELFSSLRRLQDLIMKILVLEGENEQALLRRGLVPPKHLPPASRQRPHFVAELYRRNGSR